MLATIARFWRLRSFLEDWLIQAIHFNTHNRRKLLPLNNMHLLLILLPHLLHPLYILIVCRRLSALLVLSRVLFDVVCISMIIFIQLCCLISLCDLGEGIDIERPARPQGLWRPCTIPGFLLTALQRALLEFNYYWRVINSPRCRCKSCL